MGEIFPTFFLLFFYIFPTVRDMFSSFWQDHFFPVKTKCWQIVFLEFKFSIFGSNNSKIQIVYHTLNDKTAGYVHITYSHFVAQKFATIIPSLPGRFRNFPSFLRLQFSFCRQNCVGCINNEHHIVAC